MLAWFFISSGANEDNGYSQAFTLPKTKHSQNDIWKSLFLQTFVNIVLADFISLLPASDLSCFIGSARDKKPRKHKVLV